MISQCKEFQKGIESLKVQYLSIKRKFESLSKQGCSTKDLEEIKKNIFQLENNIDDLRQKFYEFVRFCIKTGLETIGDFEVKENNGEFIVEIVKGLHNEKISIKPGYPVKLLNFIREVEYKEKLIFGRSFPISPDIILYLKKSDLLLADLRIPGGVTGIKCENIKFIEDLELPDFVDLKSLKMIFLPAVKDVNQIDQFLDRCVAKGLRSVSFHFSSEINKQDLQRLNDKYKANLFTIYKYFKG